MEKLSNSDKTHSEWVRELENYYLLSDDKLIDIYNEYQKDKERIEYNQMLIEDELRSRNILDKVKK